jgi:hypothetical protein
MPNAAIAINKTMANIEPVLKGIPIELTKNKSIFAIKFGTHRNDAFLNKKQNHQGQSKTI